MVIFGIPIGVMAFPFVDLSGDSADAFADLPLWVVIAAAFVPFVYDFISVALFGRTIGKLAFKLKVVRYVDGGRVGPTQAALRAVTPIFGNLVGLGFPLGGLFRLWEPIVYSSTAYSLIRRGLHDRAAGTIVVST